jgi:hypothetical protein
MFRKSTGNLLFYFRFDKVSWLIAVGICLTLSLLLLLSISKGATLTGMAEESTGYRYFYTLRILYGDNERPWLPQGQLVGLAHMLIQVILTTLGYPPTELFPRIDLFAYSAAILPHILVALKYIRAVAPYKILKV